MSTHQTSDTDIVFKEDKDQVSWELVKAEARPEASAISKLKKGLFYSILLFALLVAIFFHIAFFGSNWISLGIVFTGLPAFAVVAIFVTRRFWGNMSDRQSWTLSEAALTHRFGAWGGKTTVHTYPIENIENIAFFPDRIILKLKRSQRGLSTHVMNPPAFFSPELRQKLATAAKARGLKAEI